jgi:hypothetical protein
MTAASWPAKAGLASGASNDLLGDSDPGMRDGRQIYGRFADEGENRASWRRQGK